MKHLQLYEFTTKCNQYFVFQDDNKANIRLLNLFLHICTTSKPEIVLFNWQLLLLVLSVYLYREAQLSANNECENVKFETINNVQKQV